MIKEAEEKLSARIKIQDTDQLSVAHVMLESGGRRLAVTNSEIDELIINKLMKEIEKKKHKLYSQTNILISNH